MRIMISVLVLLTALAAGRPAFAEDEVSCGDTPKSQWMSEDAIKAKALEQGLDVRQIKVENGCYEIKAIDKDGAKVERVLNPVTGAVVDTESNG